METNTDNIPSCWQGVETIDAWIARQPWPEDVKQDARDMTANRPAMLNSMTRGQWKTWAEARGLTLAPVTR